MEITDATIARMKGRTKIFVSVSDTQSGVASILCLAVNGKIESVEQLGSVTVDKLYNLNS